MASQQGSLSASPELERTDLAGDFEKESTILKNYSPLIFTSSAPLPFESVQEIGRGAQGAVDEVRLTSDNTTCVRKTWIKQVSLQAAERLLLDELKILYRLRKGHHFIQYVSSYILDLEGQEGEDKEREDDTAAPSTWKAKLVEFGLLHLPRAICDLENLLAMAPQQRRDIISDAALTKAMGCLIIALHSMHQSSVRHRDIKPANILVHDRSLIFTDFGLSRDFFELSSTTEGQRVGTVVYWSPELQTGKRRGTKADVFALGCVFFEIMFTLIHSTGSNEVDIASFRPYYDIGNLSRLQEWADGAKESPENSTLLSFWLHACQRMLGRYPDLRVTASFVLQKLCERKNDDPEFASDICCDICSMEYTAGLGLEELNKLEFDDRPWTEGIDFLLCRRGSLPKQNPSESNNLFHSIRSVGRVLGLHSRWNLTFYLENGKTLYCYGTIVTEVNLRDFGDDDVERVVFSEGTYGHCVWLYKNHGWREEDLVFCKQGCDARFREAKRVRSYKITSEGLFRTLGWE